MHGHTRCFVAAALLALAIGMLAGCGGGGGDSKVLVTGVVYQSRYAGTRVTDATVNAYVWNDLTTSVGQASTGSDGRYDLNLAKTAVGKDVVLVATTPSTSTNLRGSLIVAALPSIGRTNADIDIATTLAAELALKAGADGSVTHFSDSSVQTIASQFRSWSGSDGLEPVSDGTEITGAIGGGLKPGSASATFAAGDTIVTNALGHLAETATEDVLAAKRLIRWLRDTMICLYNDGHNEQNAVREAIDEQRQVIADEVSVSSEVGQRLMTVINALWTGHEVDDGSGSTVYMPPLMGLAPGTYTWKRNSSNEKYLEYTGTVADGKSWVITSTVPDASENDRITITPTNKLDAFAFTPDAGGYTIRAINTTETDANRTLDWKVTLTFTGAATAPTKFAVDMSVKDPGLTGTFTLKGSVSGVVVNPIASDRELPSYSQLTIAGSITAPFLVASMDSLTLKWYRSTDYTGNIKSIALSNLTFTDNLSKPIAGGITSASIAFDAVASDDQTPDVAVPNTAQISGARLTFSDHTLKLNSGKITFENTVRDSGTVVMNPKTIEADIYFKSDAFMLAGTIDSTWTSLPISLDDTTPVPVTRYPVGSMTIKGQLQPHSGALGTLDSTLVFATSATAATATFTINSLSYEGETLKGTIVSTTPVDSGNLSSPTTVAVNLTESPNSLVVHITSETGATTGWISTSSTGTPAQATIGKAGDLGLSELGANTLVIKYSDGTFETAASILPN